MYRMNTVETVLGIISQENLKVEKKEEVIKKKDKEIEKIKLPEKKSNIINLEIEKKSESKNEEPLILMEEEPLILSDEIKSPKTSNEPVILSPAVRKIVNEK